MRSWRRLVTVGLLRSTKMNRWPPLLTKAQINFFEVLQFKHQPTSTQRKLTRKYQMLCCHCLSKCKKCCATHLLILISRTIVIDSMRELTVLSYLCVMSTTVKFQPLQTGSRMSSTTCLVSVWSKCNFHTAITGLSIMCSQPSAASLSLSSLP